MAQATAKTARQPRVSLKHVAEHAGCGVTTVSDILNRNIVGKYPPETRARVFRAMKQTGYTPSRAAQKLRGTRSKEIGVVLTREFDNPFFARLAHQFQRQLRQLGYRMQLQVTGQDLWTLTQFPMELLSADVDGVILGPVYESDRNHLDPLSAFEGSSIPVMLFGGPCGSPFVEHHFPHFDVGRLAGEMLFDAGHRRIAFLGGGAKAESGGRVSKEDGVRHAAERVEGEVTYLPHTDTDSYDDFYHVAASFARSWRDIPVDIRPTGVVCRNDQMAMSALAAFYDLGVRVPDDLSLVGMDNLPEARVLRPGLSTVDFRTSDQVTQIVTRLAAELDGRELVRGPVPEPRKIVRESVRRLG